MSLLLIISQHSNPFSVIWYKFRKSFIPNIFLFTHTHAENIIFSMKYVLPNIISLADMIAFSFLNYPRIT